MFYRLGAVRFLHLRSGTFLLLPDDLLLIVLAEIYHEALLRWRGINVGQSVETSEDNQGCVENTVTANAITMPERSVFDCIS